MEEFLRSEGRVSVSDTRGSSSVLCSVDGVTNEAFELKGVSATKTEQTMMDKYANKSINHMKERQLAPTVVGCAFCKRAVEQTFLNARRRPALPVDRNMFLPSGCQFCFGHNVLEHMGRS